MERGGADRPASGKRPRPEPNDDDVEEGEYPPPPPPHDDTLPLPPPPPPPPAAPPLSLEEDEAAGAAACRQPLSLEELLRKQREQQEEDAKVDFSCFSRCPQPDAVDETRRRNAPLDSLAPRQPNPLPQEKNKQPRFLTKAERQQRALQRRELEVQVARARAEEDGRARPPPPPHSSSSSYEHRREREAAAARERELAEIRAAYLPDPLAASKRVAGHARPSDRNRFRFEWDAADDTTRAADPYFAAAAAAGGGGGGCVGGSGGRGHHHRNERQGGTSSSRGGYGDGRYHQPQHAGGGGGPPPPPLRANARPDPLLADNLPAQRRSGDNSHGGQQHWSTKSLREMTERDWRIFREDFNISYKSLRGGDAVKPLRTWDESALPPELRSVRNFCRPQQTTKRRRCARP